MTARTVRKPLVLAICCLSLFIVSMDATIVNVALPSIRHDLGGTVSGLQWIIDAYTLVLASFLMLSGTTADRLGRRRTFQVGLALFSAGSLLCGLAPSVGWLIVFRMVQAVGGSMLNPVAMSIITNTFTEAKERARAIGVWGAVVGISMALGPLIGGTLTDIVGWRAIFLVNIPIGAAAIVLSALFVPESKAARARRFDPVGQLAVIVILASLIFGLIEGPRIGWSSPTTLGIFALTVIGVVGLIVYEPRRSDPLVDLRFFRSIPFTSASITAVCAFGAYGGFLFLNTLYLQEVRGISAFTTGLLMLPLAVATIAASPISGHLVGTIGTRVPLIVAGVGITVSALSMTALGSATPLWALLGGYALFGIGFGAVNAPITTTAVSGMPRAQAGAASGIASTSRQVGVSLGVAIAGSLTGIGGSTVVSHTFPVATHPFWWVVVGCGLAIIALAFVANSRRAVRSMLAVAPLLSEEEALVTGSLSTVASGPTRNVGDR